MTIETADRDQQRSRNAGNATPVAAPRGKRGRRFRGGGQSLLAQGEPIVWLNGAGLVVCLTMIVGLLLLVIYQGITTFWPEAVIQVQTIGGATHLGEVTRVDAYELNYSGLASLTGPTQEAAGALLHRRLRGEIQRLLDSGKLSEHLHGLEPAIVKAAQAAVQMTPQVRDARGADSMDLQDALRTNFAKHHETFCDKLQQQLQEAVAADATGAALFALWQGFQEAEADWLALPEVTEMRQALVDDAPTCASVWSSQALALLSIKAVVPMRRRLLRTGNYELTNEHFNWVSDFEIVPESEQRPDWAVVFERLAWGRFYGFPKELRLEGETIAGSPAEIWTAFEKHHPEIRARWRQRRRLEMVEIGEVNRQLEEERLSLRQVALKHGENSASWQAARAGFQKTKTALEQRFAELRDEIQQLDQRNEQYQLVVETAQGQTHALALADIVRAYPPQQLSFLQRLATYLSRWREFLLDAPREANSEGGVLPAIWGTVVMTMLMSIAVVPFGVLAALYLREYAKSGPLVSAVRIAVNNLAGVPSIVFGVFGLGFFCYIIGASIDELFFSAKLPSPTFGTGGLMWAALTLALLTLPVVIVATEEALAAVPRSMREGSLACGATQWQTIRRIVLPRAMPGIMTGMILAMARGAGEVAPLMLVGAVKLAPELPVDGLFPYLHLERSFMHLGFHIYDLGFQSQNSEAAKSMVFTTTLLLIGVIALMNVLAIWLRARLRRKFEFSQF